MKTSAIVTAALVAVLLAGCRAPQKIPDLSPVSERWQKVPKEIAAPVVYTVSGMEGVRTAAAPYSQGRTADIYYPAGYTFTSPLPVVVFAMGYSTAQTEGWFGAKLKDMGQYVSWGQLVAASGMIGVTYETDFPDDDISAVLSFVRSRAADFGFDAGRVAIWACSGNAQTGLVALTDKGAQRSGATRCGVLYYPVVSYFMNKGEEVMPAPFKRALRSDVPLLYVKVGKDRPEWMEQSEIFLSANQKQGAPLKVISYDQGIHGFDTDQDNEESRRIVGQTIEFLKANLKK
jgi:hypothetical protein